MSDLDEARRKEYRSHLKMIPVAFVLLIIFIGIYFIVLSEEINIYSIRVWGAAKNLWFVNCVALGGLGVVIVSASVSLLLMLSLLAKHLGGKLRPWMPICLSSVILVIGFLLLLLFKSFDAQIRSNITSINGWVDNYFGDGFLEIVADFLFMNALVFIVFSVISLLIFTVSLPSAAKSIANEIKKVGDERE